MCGQEEVFSLTLSLDGADLAGVSPALTGHSGAAARLLRCVCRFWSLTAAVLKFGVAVVHSHILNKNKSGVNVETLPDGFLVSGDHTSPTENLETCTGYSRNAKFTLTK